MGPIKWRCVWHLLWEIYYKDLEAASWQGRCVFLPVGIAAPLLAVRGFGCAWFLGQWTTFSGSHACLHFRRCCRSKEQFPDTWVMIITPVNRRRPGLLENVSSLGWNESTLSPLGKRSLLCMQTWRRPLRHWRSLCVTGSWLPRCSPYTWSGLAASCPFVCLRSIVRLSCSCAARFLVSLSYGALQMPPGWRFFVKLGSLLGLLLPSCDCFLILMNCSLVVLFISVHGSY